MAELPLEQHLIELGVAQNVHQAKHIVRGLQLDNLPTIEAKCERAKLYRQWRNRGEASADARAKAIAGLKPFQLVESVERLSPERKKQIMRELGDYE